MSELKMDEAEAQPQPTQNRSWVIILVAGLVIICFLALVLGGVFAYSSSATQDEPGFFLLPVFLAPEATPATEQPVAEPTPTPVIPTVVVTVVAPTREQIVVTATPEPGGEQPDPEPTEEPEPPPNPEPTEEPAQ